MASDESKPTKAGPGIPGRRGIKSKTVKATLANKDVLDMFQNVIGTSNGGVALWVAHPKYQRIAHHVGRFIKLISLFRGSSVMQLFPGPLDHLGLYLESLEVQFAQSFCAPDLAPYMPPDAVVGMADDYEGIPPEVAAEFSARASAVKSCNLANLIVTTCKNLIQHKKSLEKQQALKDRFLMHGVGMAFCPLPDLPQVNFKQIYIDDRLNAADREYVLTILHKLYAIGHDVYEAVSAPDVDVDEFTDVIMTSIGDVRKHIPRCEQAFDKIEESVGLLKGNFGDYYKDYIASNNPTIIMENFVLDVSKSTQSSPVVAQQFRQIIKHYKQIVAQKSSNPKLASLFQQVDANFQELESKGRDADLEGGDDDEDAAPADAPAAETLPSETEGASAEAAPEEVSAAPPVATPTKPGKRARRRRAQKAREKAEARGDEGLADELDREAKEVAPAEPVDVPAEPVDVPAEPVGGLTEPVGAPDEETLEALAADEAFADAVVASAPDKWFALGPQAVPEPEEDTADA
jgi:hypothetical protein